MELTKEQLKQFMKEAIGVEIDELKQQIKENQTNWGSVIQSGVDFVNPEKAKAEKGIRVARIFRAIAAAKGDPEAAASYAKKQWGDDEVAKALSAGAGAAGGFIVPAEYSTEIIELLGPRAVVRASGARRMDMRYGKLEIPKLTGGATANYVGENSNIPTSEQTFGNIIMTAKKLACLVPMSNDLLRYSSPNADTIVRDDIITQMARREDLGFIRGDGLQNTPKGIRNWMAAGNVVNANAVVNLANVTTDLGLLILKLQEADVPFIQPGWLIAPRSAHYLMTVRDGNGNYAFKDEMAKGTLLGIPFKVTTQIPTNLGGGGNESEVYLVDFADAIIGEAMEIIIDASNVAAYFDNNNVVAAFSQDQTVIRAIAQHDFALRHDASAARLDQVTWGV